MEVGVVAASSIEYSGVELAARFSSDDAVLDRRTIVQKQVFWQVGNPSLSKDLVDEILANVDGRDTSLLRDVLANSAFLDWPSDRRKFKFSASLEMESTALLNEGINKTSVAEVVVSTCFDGSTVDGVFNMVTSKLVFSDNMSVEVAAGESTMLELSRSAFVDENDPFISEGACVIDVIRTVLV